MYMNSMVVGCGNEGMGRGLFIYKIKNLINNHFIICLKKWFRNLFSPSSLLILWVITSQIDYIFI